MYLLGWFAVGFVLANCAAYLARQWPRGGSIKPLWPRHSTASRRTIAGWLGALLIVFLLLLWFVGASDRAGLWEWVIRARSPFLGARFQWLMWGAALGVLAQVFRLEIARISRQAFDATLGKGENTAWALQSTLALLIIAAAVLAIKPDLLSYLRSFEYGGFKATFADHSTNTRLADLNYKDLLWGSTLEQYEEFEESYLGADSDRAKFGDLFVYNKISSERKAITAALLRNYAQPVIRALICFERHHSIDAMAQDVGLVKFGARWVDFLASLKSKDSEITFDIVQPFLHDVSRLGSATSRYMSAIVPDCAPVATVDDVVIRYDAMTIVSNYNNGLAKLREDHRTRPTFRVLALIDAYLVGAAGDLLVVLQGQREKAEFLARCLTGLPKRTT